MAIADFLDEASEPSVAWDGQRLRDLSTYRVPEFLFGPRKELLYADMYREWASWFIRSVADPLLYTDESITWIRIFGDVYAALSKAMDSAASGDIKRLAQVVSQRVLLERENKNFAKRRNAFTRRDKQDLLDLAGSIPRCWITGRKFTEEAIDKFLGNAPHAQSLPYLVDLYRPIGLQSRDVDIEIDHLFAYSKGGGEGDNLKLVCGWANMHKSNYSSIYDNFNVPRISRRATFTSLPHQFWVVRILGVSRKCEATPQCENSSDNAELTIELINPFGAPVPTNMRVVCRDHDSLKAADRLRPRHEVQRIWS